MAEEVTSELATNRPTSITVIAWFLIAAASLSVILSVVLIGNPITKELMAKDPVPIPLQYLILYLSPAISIVAGIAMLKRKNWGRFLYAVWGVVGFVIGIASSPMKAAMIPGFIFYVIVVIFLFLPKANMYFSPREPPNNAQSV